VIAPDVFKQSMPKINKKKKSKTVVKKAKKLRKKAP